MLGVSLHNGPTWVVPGGEESSRWGFRLHIACYLVPDT